MSDVPYFTRVRLAIDDVDAGAPVDLDGLHADLRAEDAKVDRFRRQPGGEQLASTSLLLGLYIEAIERLKADDVVGARDRYQRAMDVSIAANGGPEAFADLLVRYAETMERARSILQERRDRQ